jgi:hypothetical protein
VATQTKPAIPLQLRERLAKAAMKDWDTIVGGVIADAVGGDHEARKLLLSLVPRPQFSPTPIGSPVRGLRLGTLEDAIASLSIVAQLAAEGRIGLSEAKALSDLIQRVIDARAAADLEQIKEQLEDLKRDVRGGSKVVEGEIVPTWGRLGG